MEEEWFKKPTALSSVESGWRRVTTMLGPGLNSQKIKDRCLRKITSFQTKQPSYLIPVHSCFKNRPPDNLKKM